MNLPRPVSLTVAENGQPQALKLGGRAVLITSIEDCWRIDEEWWREEISRRYYLLLLEDGRLVTVFHDGVGDRWYRQNYT